MALHQKKDKNSPRRGLLHRLRIHMAGFRAKLLAAFLLCTLLPLSVVGFVSYAISYSIAQKQILESVCLTAGQQNYQIDSIIRRTEQVADTLQYSLYTLNTARTGELSGYIEALTSLRNNISLYKSSFGFYHICVFLPPEQFGSNEGLTFYSLEDLNRFRLSEAEINRLGSSSLWAARPDVSLPFILNYNLTKTDTAVCCRALQNQGSGRMEYAFILLVDIREFEEILSASYEGETGILSYILTPDGYVAASSDMDTEGIFLSDSLRDPLIEASGSTIKMDGSFYNVLPFSNGWYQVTKVPESYISSSTGVLLRTVLLTILLSIPAACAVVFFFSRTLTKRLQALASAMENYRLRTPEGGQSLPNLPKPSAPPEYYDEVDLLGVTFDQMVHTIHENLNSILDLSLSEEKLKYQLLQSQINPHFLYNILGSIRNCILLGRLDTADRMIANLTRFYRLTLRRSGELIRIQDELEISVLYLEMEQLCRGGSLSWEIHTEEGIENFLICKFTLQPFLENCIQHGITGRTPDIHIVLSVRYGEDTVIISIADNGAGIPEKQLFELQKTLLGKEVNYSRHFGISNVSARIAGERYGSGHVTIDSRQYHGTTVRLEFGQMEENDEEDHDC